MLSEEGVLDKLHGALEASPYVATHRHVAPLLPWDAPNPVVGRMVIADLSPELPGEAWHAVAVGLDPQGSIFSTLQRSLETTFGLEAPTTVIRVQAGYISELERSPGGIALWGTTAVDLETVPALVPYVRNAMLVPGVHRMAPIRERIRTFDEFMGTLSGHDGSDKVDMRHQPRSEYLRVLGVVVNNLQD